VYDTGAIAVDKLATDANVLAHVLYMPFGEAATRLPSLKYTAHSTFVFSRGTEEYEQTDTSTVVQDSQGDFHVVLSTPGSELEVYLVGDTLYVRQDQGLLRHKPRRDVEANNWTDVAFSSARKAVELFQPRLKLAEARAETVAGRAATRYNLTLAANSADSLTIPEPLPTTTGAVAPPARWRELARPLDLRGFLWVDNATGVLMKVSITGRLEIADRQVRPTQLELRFDSEIQDVGKVASVKAPESVAEFRRTARPKNLLSFFADHLDEDPANAAAKPAKPAAETKPVDEAEPEDGADN